MRKVMVLEHMSLNGVIQGPGSPQEDTTGGFELGGWISGYSDPVLRLSSQGENELRIRSYARTKNL